METIKVLRQTKKGNWIRTPVTIERRDGRIYFFKAPDIIETPFAMKDEIKAMQGYRWHAHREEGEGYCDGRKVWSCLDSCRNNFNLDFMTGGNPYANWEQPLVQYQYERPLRAHQELMANHCLTYHYKILAAEMGTGKTLAAIEVLEKSLLNDWWWVAPRSALNAVEREFVKWGLRVSPNLMTYDKLRTIMRNWKSGDPAPQGVIFDESSRLKGPTSQRTKAYCRISRRGGNRRWNAGSQKPRSSKASAPSFTIANGSTCWTGWVCSVPVRWSRNPASHPTWHTLPI